MRLLACVLILLSASALAGCSGSPPGPSPSATSSATEFTVQGDNRIAAPVLTDTVHVLAHPGVTTRAPDSYTDLRIPLRAFSESVASPATGVPHWQVAVTDGLTAVVGTATFWVEVRGTVLSNPNPLVDHCYWEFRFLTGDANTGNSHFAPCVKEEATVAEGVRAITFAFDLTGLAVAPGEDLAFELYTTDLSRAPDATVELLTGSILHDSRVQLVGLSLPVDGSALLSTT